ncbi:hypothetical protein KR009_011725 [Drosophila setifemur]|nr:hypothetical protein KR009_011725 [Drosophila setifemur]
MNTHYLTTSRSNPQFFIFSQIFGTDFDWRNYNLENVQQAAWQDFWQREGHELLEQKWHKRFPEYKALIEAVTTEERSLWKELWEKHASNSSAKFWHTLSCAFENYQNDLTKAFEQEDTLQEVEEVFENLNVSEKRRIKKRKQKALAEGEKDDCYLTANDDPEDLDEEEQLRLYGLPTSFGTKSIKKPRQPRQELNKSSSESEGSEESIIMEVNKNNPLHGVKSGYVSKKQQSRQNKINKSKARMPEFMQEKDNSNMVRYWLKRFSLFSRFDQGIRLDRESWFSVTPEKIAKQTARRLACDIIVDAFCGCGGNAIQFANTCGRVIAIDIDAEKIAMAKHNAGIYGVAHKIEFIQADFLQFAASTKIRPDVVFLSPPWGGPVYKKRATFDIEQSLQPVGATQLMQLSRRLADNVGFFLPRNSNMNQVVALSGAGQKCEVEHNYLDTRMVALTAYYGQGLIRQ